MANNFILFLNAIGEKISNDSNNNSLIQQQQEYVNYLNTCSIIIQPDIYQVIRSLTALDYNIKKPVSVDEVVIENPDSSRYAFPILRYSVSKECPNDEVSTAILKAMRRRTNNIIRTRCMTFHQELKQIMNAFEYENMVCNNQAKFWGYAVDNIFQTDKAIYLEVYAIDNQLALEHYKQSVR